MRFLISSWGSRGDLHPFLSLGQGLLRRGHQVSLVGPVHWREETELSGICFYKTSETPLAQVFAQDAKIFSAKSGGLDSLRALVQRGLVPSLEATLSVLLKTAKTHDVLLAHPFAYAAPIAAEITGKIWITVTLAPGIIPSVFTYPAPHYGKAGSDLISRQLQRLVWAVGKRLVAPIVDPEINHFREKHGVAPQNHLFFKGHSKLLNLQLYSGHFAPVPSDWSAEKKQGGFCYFDPGTTTKLPAEVEAFLIRGAKPVLVTLGSAITLQAGTFFQDASLALERLGLRGIFLYGGEKNRPVLPSSQLAISYLPFAQILPHVCSAIHQGGIGTLAQSMRAGLPNLICPYAFDQPNNARRAEALGIAQVILPNRRNSRHMAELLERLLASKASEKAADLSTKLQAEDGVTRSCEIIEAAVEI